jgi:hypothetical protein
VYGDVDALAVAFAAVDSIQLAHADADAVLFWDIVGVTERNMHAVTGTERKHIGHADAGSYFDAVPVDVSD